MKILSRKKLQQNKSLLQAAFIIVLTIFLFVLFAT